jgi:hypothetical protein
MTPNPLVTYQLINLSHLLLSEKEFRPIQKVIDGLENKLNCSLLTLIVCIDQSDDLKSFIKRRVLTHDSRVVMHQRITKYEIMQELEKINAIIVMKLSRLQHEIRFRQVRV